MIARIRTRLRAIVQRRTTDDDLDAEIRYHVEREVERNVVDAHPDRSSDLLRRHQLNRSVR